MSTPAGFLPRSVVGDAVVVRASVAGSALPLVYFAGLVAVPLELSGQGWTPLETGLLLLPGAVIGSTVSFNSARVLARLGRRRGAILGLAVSGTGALVAVGTGWSAWLAGAGFLGLAVGYALAQPALVGAIAAAAAADVRGAALGSFTLLFFVGAGLGSAVVGGLADVVTLSGTLAVALAAPVIAIVVLARARPHPAWAAPDTPRSVSVSR